MKRMMLYFGSFNPVHCGHIALAEYAVEQGLCDEMVLIVSPQSPFKECGGLAPEMDRFEMAEMACTGSRYPDKIKASAIEFLLSRPSYTIDTLRYLRKNFGSGIEFSLLMGADQLAGLGAWKECEELLSEYPLYIYPRRGQQPNDPQPALPKGRITLLDGAPLVDISASDIRERIQRGEQTSELLPPGVAEYIRRKGLWSPTAYIASLTAQIDARKSEPAEPQDAQLYVDRGVLHYRLQEWGPALNDFNRALKIDPEHAEAKQYIEMAQEILAFRYKDIYNP